MNAQQAILPLEGCAEVECRPLGSNVYRLSLVKESSAVTRAGVAPAQSGHYSFARINPLLVFALALIVALLCVSAVAALVEGLQLLAERGVIPTSLTLLERLTPQS